MSADADPWADMDEDQRREEFRSAWEQHVLAMADAQVAPRRVEMRRLADAGREVIAGLVATSAPEDVLRRAADGLDQVAALLAEYEQAGHIYEGFSESANSGDPHAMFDHSPFLGQSNPLAPPIRLRIEGSQVFGDVRFGAGYEGPPGCVHGGYVAAGFDEVLGAAQSLSGRPGMTGTLTVRYEKPTPLDEPITYEAWLERTEGRKNIAMGVLRHGDTVTARAEGIFIAIDREKFLSLKQARDARSGRSA